ncbi:sugar ABC transporter ATP-binding protein [Brevibacillus centrosporus]|uniref:sugar ABC transporter ATP-binding protein n=1 Tax=Brevibacillus centrosporus TaxID=54910 RepID=UPI000F0A3B4F|nr:sugar ABC transporter ATP-binding protein [Brevibacillus centrosporus]MEC2129747.1 sugar ABC transporter ATP-binding protein [Brevibacillus centrosporus]RNB67191.1 sugar ABC transporter ATP-binding protein [Brevibacillus centrosporus]GED32899.1 ribose import ATP-binding protein RbsA [Brevibacillus centrosporus]
MSAYLLEMKGINKSFPGVKVLSDVQLNLKSGELVALMGENGAGKSTLMKILGGIYERDAGTIIVKGETQEKMTPDIASSRGIAIIHQEMNLIPHLSVMENIFLGREYTYGKSGIVNWRKMRQETKRWLDQLAIKLDPDTLVGDLSVGQQQMIEIAKALSMQADILVLDEPTAALTNREIDALFDMIASLKEKGVGMIYISHRMEEIFQVSDRITVLRDGQYVGTVETAETNLDELVKMMVGREITDRFPKVEVQLGGERLRVENLNVKDKLSNISFSIKSGEIVGVAGLMGAGRTEMAKALFGLEKVREGQILVDGKPVRVTRPIDAISAGIALVTEDRKEEGLVLSLSVRENISLPNLQKVSSLGVMKPRDEQVLSNDAIQRLFIKTAGGEQIVGSLSGGNQQKVVIGKWLAKKPKILILDEPTRGVDIGAKKEIYDIMNRLAQDGVAILMISSELPEVLGMSDRVLVMHEGRITGEFTREEATQEMIMRAATGGTSHAV